MKNHLKSSKIFVVNLLHRLKLRFAKKELLLLQKLINLYYQSHMKQPKYKEESIDGWANENEINYDAIALTDIIKRKATVGVLPQISYHKSKIQTEHHKIHQSQQLRIPKEKIPNHINQFLKMRREKTEGYECNDSQSTTFQNSKECLPIKQERQSPHSPYMTDFQELQKANRYSAFNEIESNDQKCSKNESIQQQNFTFFKTMKNNHHNCKSHEFIRQVPQKIESPKKMQCKLYVKLNTLEMVNDLRKQFRHDCIEKINAKGCLSESRQLLAEKRKRKNASKLGSESVEKMNEKLRQTFTKKDIFMKHKRKQSKNDNVEFSDQVIFSNNSIIVNKQTMSSPFIHSKIQIIKPQKYPLLFK